ncbi:MAG: ThiF family adenylyltransferase [Chloroflexota bacterium]|nr:ThiF family adenylyltransferase [Chloroflexota bacterium]
MKKEELHKEIFNRNYGLVTEEEQEILRTSTVAVAGAGGGGGISAERIVRLGVEHIKLADPDLFETSNINRQFACTYNNVGKKKVFEVANALKEINPNLQVDVYPEGITEDNIDDFLDGADILVEEIEGYYFRIRALLYKAARKKGIYGLRSDTFGFCAPLYIFAPDGMTFEEFFDLPPAEEIDPKMTDASGIYREKFFFNKRAPNSTPIELIPDVVAKKRPFMVLSFGCTMIGTLTSSAVMRILLKRGEPIVAPKAVNADLYAWEFDIIDFSDHCGK